MIQKFLVQVEDHRDTRWLIDSEELRRRLAIFSRHIVAAVTEGPQPGILVIQEEAPGPQEQAEPRERARRNFCRVIVRAGESVTRGDRQRRELEGSKPVTAARPPARKRGVNGASERQLPNTIQVKPFYPHAAD